MAKKIYVGVDGVARKIKKAYLGINGTARKVKKAYLGIGGVARPVFSGGELAYYGSSEDGQIPFLPKATYEQWRNGVSTTNYGAISNSINGTQAHFMFLNPSFTVSSLTPTNLAQTIGNYTGVSFQENVVYGGGRNINGYASNQVIYFDSSQTLHTASNMSKGRNCSGGAISGINCLFAGGSNGSTSYNTIDAYNASFTRVACSATLDKAGTTQGASFSGKAVFCTAGGDTGYLCSVSPSLTKTTIGTAPIRGNAHFQVAAAGEYLILVNSYGTEWAVFSKELTALAPISAGDNYCSGVMLGDIFVAAGGVSNPGHKKVLTIDTNLTRSSTLQLPEERGLMIGLTLGNYAIFAGGFHYSGSNGMATNTLDIYTVN